MANNDKRKPSDDFSITPARDEIASFQKTRSKSFISNLGEVPEVAAGGSSTSLKVTLAVVTIALIMTAVLAGFLQQRLKQAEKTIQLTEARVADLENRLSVTDESMGESAERLAALETKQQSHSKSLNNVKSFIDSTEQQLTKNAQTTASLSQKLTQLNSLNSKLASNEKKLKLLESSLENSNDKVNRFNTKIIKVERLSNENKERLDSVDNFRRKVNADLMKLSSGTP